MSADFSLSIDRTDLTLDPLVLHGTRQDGWCLMPGWQIPGLVPNNAMAGSPDTHGAVATHFTWQLAFMSGDVVLVGADNATDVGNAITELRVALSRLSFTITQDWGGYDEDRETRGVATITPSPLTYVSVSRDEPVYSLNIPVYPLAVP